MESSGCAATRRSRRSPPQRGRQHRIAKGARGHPGSVGSKPATKVQQLEFGNWTQTPPAATHASVPGPPMAPAHWSASPDDASSASPASDASFCARHASGPSPKSSPPSAVVGQADPFAPAPASEAAAGIIASVTPASTLWGATPVVSWCPPQCEATANTATTPATPLTKTTRITDGPFASVGSTVCNGHSWPSTLVTHAACRAYATIYRAAGPSLRKITAFYAGEGRDSNPRRAFDPRPLSKRVPSATRSPLLGKAARSYHQMGRPQV